MRSSYTELSKTNIAKMHAPHSAAGHQTRFRVIITPDSVIIKPESVRSFNKCVCVREAGKSKHLRTSHVH